MSQTTNGRASPPIEKKADYIEWFVRYSDDLAFVRKLYHEDLDRFVTSCRDGALRELERSKTADELFDRVSDLYLHYEANIKPLVARRRGLAFCPPELQGAAVSMLVNIAVGREFLMKQYQHMQDTTLLMVFDIDALSPEILPSPSSPPAQQSEETPVHGPASGVSPFPVMRARTGVVERMYQLWRYKALLIRNPKAAGPVEYRFMFTVMKDEGEIVLLISSERNRMTSALLKVAAEELPEIDISTKNKGFFLCSVDRKGHHQNYGSSPAWEDIDRFAERAIQLAKQQLRVAVVQEIYRRIHRRWYYVGGVFLLTVLMGVYFAIR